MLIMKIIIHVLAKVTMIRKKNIIIFRLFYNIEKEIVNPCLNIDQNSEFEKKPKYKGNRAKIIKKCKEDKFNNEDNLDEL